MYGQLYREKAFLVSAGLKQQNGHLTQVEVDEMLGLMSHVAAKVPPNDAVPGRVIFLVKLLSGTKTHCSHEMCGEMGSEICYKYKETYSLMKYIDEAYSVISTLYIMCLKSIPSFMVSMASNHYCWSEMNNVRFYLTGHHSSCSSSDHSTLLGVDSI